MLPSSQQLGQGLTVGLCSQFTQGKLGMFKRITLGTKGCVA
jgi:hypothetical protein